MWISLSTPQGVLFEEYLSILENILARVRYPFRFPIGVRQDGCTLLEVNTTGSPRVYIHLGVFPLDAFMLVYKIRMWSIVFRRLPNCRITTPRRHFHFLLLNMVWCVIKFYNFKRFLACMIFLTTRSVLVFLPGNRSMAWIILVSAFHLSCKFLARL